VGLPDSLIGRAVDFGSTGCRFDSYSGIINTYTGSTTVVRFAVNEVVAGSNPALCAWETWQSGRMRLTRNQMRLITSVGSNPTVSAASV
jgi:hypothetical protein